MPSADDALAELRAGNLRFVQGRPQHPHQDADRRAELAGGQAPFAVILACSDSRVSAEILFDQGLGDLFVVRTAGQVVDDVALGSIEFGVAALGAPLVVVLGHESCGAVKATIDVLDGGPMPDGAIARLVEMVMPSAVMARARDERALDEVVAEHARRTAAALTERSPALTNRVDDGSVAVVAMRYSLIDGKAELLAP